MTVPFARARNDEQRELRRATILATAARMLEADTRVASLTLNELSRQVGLAKSNVMRYFETREAVLLELLGAEYGRWLDDLDEALRAEPAATSTPASDRASAVDEFAQAAAATLASRPVLAELLASTAAVLEHNVSPEIAAAHKRRALDHAARLTAAVEARIGPLGVDDRLVVAGGLNLVIGGVWTACRPSRSMIAAYADEPELSAFQLDFPTAVRELIATLLTGVLVRPASLSP